MMKKSDKRERLVQYFGEVLGMKNKTASEYEHFDSLSKRVGIRAEPFRKVRNQLKTELDFCSKEMADTLKEIERLDRKKLRRVI
jgi:hypothetical protein